MTVVLSVGLLNHTAIWWWQFHNYQSSRFSGLTIPASMPLYDFSASESNGFRHNWFDYTLVLAYYGMLTHYGPVMPYGIIELGQHWPHQAITWTNFNLSSEVFSGIYPETNFPWRTHELPYLWVFSTTNFSTYLSKFHRKQDYWSKFPLRTWVISMLSAKETSADGHD